MDLRKAREQDYAWWEPDWWGNHEQPEGDRFALEVLPLTVGEAERFEVGLREFRSDPAKLLEKLGERVRASRGITFDDEPATPAQILEQLTVDKIQDLQMVLVYGVTEKEGKG